MIRTGDGTVCFSEFVKAKRCAIINKFVGSTVYDCDEEQAAWNYLSLSREGLRNFAFSLYDLDASGDIVSPQSLS